MNLVATYNFGRVPYAEYTIPSMRTYAHRTGADFIEHTYFPHQQLYGTAPNWFKIEAIRRLASQKEYRAMLLLDADAMILGSCTNLFRLVRQGEIGAVVDMGIPNKDGRLRDWSRGIPWVREADLAGAYFNAGVLLVTHVAASALKQGGFLDGPFRDEWPEDQHYLNLAVSAAGVPIHWLPDKYNWLAPQNKAGEGKGIVHFVGDTKPLAEEYFLRHGKFRG